MATGSAQDPFHNVQDETPEQAARSAAAEARAIAAHAREDQRALDYHESVVKSEQYMVNQLDALRVQEGPLARHRVVFEIARERTTWAFASTTPQKVFDFAEAFADLYCAKYPALTPAV